MNNQRSMPAVPHVYRNLVVRVIAYAVILTALMYAAVDQLGNVVFNLTYAYTVVLGVSFLAALEILVMLRNTPRHTTTTVLLLMSMVLALLAFMAIRTQAFVSDRHLLESMISHHANSLLMCEQATIADQQVQQLCENIRSGQQAEIEWMRLKLESLK